MQREMKIGRFVKPEEIAAPANLGASEEGAYITNHSYSAGHPRGVVQMMQLA